MKWAALVNCVLALASMLANVYHHELGLAGAWFSSFMGWMLVTAYNWERT